MQGTFNPFLGDGYYSVYADTGETSYLAYTASSDFAFATGDFTVEFFVHLGIMSTGVQDFLEHIQVQGLEQVGQFK